MIYLFALAVTLLLIVGTGRDVYRKRTSRLPPGPPGLFLLGNILQLPQTFLFRKLHSWTRAYGPFYAFWIMSQPFIVISDVSVAADVLDRMSGVTSDRPRMIKAREFYFRGLMTTLQDRTPIWRSTRRAMHTSLNVRAATQFNPMQAQDAAYLTLGFLQHPEVSFHKHTHRFATSVITRCLYGGEAIPLLGPGPTELIERLGAESAPACMPQNSAVDMLPILQPLSKRFKWLRRSADKWFETTDREATRLYDGAVPTDAWGATTLVHDLNTNSEKYELPRRQAIWLGLTIYLAAQETSHTALRIFALAMLHHPDVVKTAQAQLDAVCGDRLPTFEDHDQLPYIQAIIKESLRWRSGVPLGLPHVASEDFQYEGYIVPKGTILLDNIWSQTRDTAVYQDPETFDPSRFLDESGKLRPVTPDTRLDQLGFGHGRRACPGRDFAFNSMFIACTLLLWAFDWDWARDGEGKQLVCGTDEFVDAGIVVMPKPFNVVLTPRKEGLEERLLAAIKD